MRTLTILAAALLLLACQSEEDQTDAALAGARGALLPFATAAPYIPPGTPDGFTVMCMPVAINGERFTDYCLTAGEFRTAVEALAEIDNAINQPR